MKTLPLMGIILFLLSATLLNACATSSNYQDPFQRPQIHWEPDIRLKITEADSILGNQSRLEKTTSYIEGSIKTYQSAFRDDWHDKVTKKTGILYYMYEEYPNPESAVSFLHSTLDANSISRQASAKTESGAQLFYLTGGEVVRMVMIIKENVLLRLKVNQVTSRYQLSEFQRISQKLANQL